MPLARLSSAASSPLPATRTPPAFGATVLADGVEFALYATTAAACAVRLFDSEGRITSTRPLTPRGDGIFAAMFDDVRPGALYKFVLGGREVPDPYARWLPHGVHGPAAVTESAHRFRHTHVARPLNQQVIYELHVGTFTTEGSYAAAIKRLPYLVELGVTTIELMPIAAFDGARGWGYDGVALFAPFAGYGTPDELRAFVDEAHGLGLSVLLDVVYNHFGPSGNYLSAYAPEYFTKEIRNAWGDAPDFTHPFLRRLVMDNATYWLKDFRFDGLRLDAIHAIVDPSPCHILRDLETEVRRAHPAALIIAEDERNDPIAVDAHGLDGVWADDFHHVVRVLLTGEADGYYAAYPRNVVSLAETINAGWLFRGQIYPTTGKSRGREAGHLDAHRFVYCIQNHDQVGNRALGDRLSDVVPIEAYCAASALLLFLPMTPLLFQGQEWAATAPFQFFTDHEVALGDLIREGRRREFATFAAMTDGQVAIPDPQDPETFVRSKLRWEELVEDRHQHVHFLYRHLLQLRREDPVLSVANRAGLRAEAFGSLLQVVRTADAGARTLLVNLTAQPVSLAPVADKIAGRPVLLSTCDFFPALVALPPFGAVIFA